MGGKTVVSGKVPIGNFEYVDYKNLNARQKEAHNFQKLAGILADYGFICIRLSDDWQKADFLALHKDGFTLKVQLKSRLTIDEKYHGKSLYIAFPSRRNGDWYLIEYDKLVALAKNNTPWAGTNSWKKGSYSTREANQKFLFALERYKIKARGAV